MESGKKNPNPVEKKVFRKLAEIADILKEYQSLKDKIGKKAVLHKLKAKVRQMPNPEKRVAIAFAVITCLNEGKAIEAGELVRRVTCLTDLSLPEATYLLDRKLAAMERVGVINAIKPTAEMQIQTLDPEPDEVLDEYCDIELRKKLLEQIGGMYQ